MSICSGAISPSTTNATSAFKPSLVCGKTRCFGASSPSIRHTWWAPLPQSTPTRLKTFVISFSVPVWVVGWRTLSEPVLALVISGANFLLDVIPYRHSEAAQILGGRSTALLPGCGAHIRKRLWNNVQARLRARPLRSTDHPQRPVVLAGRRGTPRAEAAGPPTELEARKPPLSQRRRGSVAPFMNGSHAGRKPKEGSKATAAATPRGRAAIARSASVRARVVRGSTLRPRGGSATGRAGATCGPARTPRCRGRDSSRPSAGAGAGRCSPKWRETAPHNARH